MELVLAFCMQALGERSLIKATFGASMLLLNDTKSVKL